MAESVYIQQERKHFLLNSRAEYNRCAVPRVTAKLGDKYYKKWEKQIEDETLKENILEEKIRILRKERNLDRKCKKNDQPASKRRKLDEENYIECKLEVGKPEGKLKGEKRKV